MSSALIFEMFPEDVELVSSSFKTPPPQTKNKRRTFAAFKRRFGKQKFDVLCEPTTVSDFNSVFSPQLNDSSEHCGSSSVGCIDLDRASSKKRVVYDLTHDSPSPPHFPEEVESDDDLNSCDSVETLVMPVAETFEDALFYAVEDSLSTVEEDKDDDECIRITEETKTCWKRACRSRSPMFGSPNNANNTVDYCSSPGY